MIGDDGGSLVHATSVEIDGRGVLITGASGAGKTALGLMLIRRALVADIAATLVSDDQTELRVSDGEILASAPAAIKGKVEIRGFGIVDTGLQVSEAVSVALVAQLVPQQEAIRFHLNQTMEVRGIDLPTLKLTKSDRDTACTACFAALGLPVWV